MQQTDSSRRRVRRRFAQSVAGLAVVLAAVVALAIPAAADTIPFTGQGTNADGTCGSFEGTPPDPGGTQTWQFNLTGTDGPATMSASFSDGTSVTDLADDSPHPGNVSKWEIVTDAGASILPGASATRPENEGQANFVVSHCTAGGTKPPPTTPTPETQPAAPQAPSVPVPVTAAARFTG